MRMKVSGLRLPRPGVRRAPAAIIRECDPPVMVLPAEVAIFGENDQEGTVYDGSAEFDAEGNATIIVDLGQVPTVGSAVQIVIQPYPEMEPIYISGILLPGGLDGSLVIDTGEPSP